ncbi:MAG: flagellar basal body rod protein FlgC [bacterium]
MGIFSGLNISATGLRAQRVRQNIIASNIANAETTRTNEGGPYRKKTVIFEQDPSQRDFLMLFGKQRLDGALKRKEHMRIPKPDFPYNNEKIGNGVKINGIHEDENQPRMVYEPEHPDADAAGYVAKPNVNIVQEMVDMISATRAYEANVTALSATKGMLMKALEI